jgi:hypothetical protein
LLPLLHSGETIHRAPPRSGDDHGPTSTIVHKPITAAPTPKVKAKSQGRRIRRSREELEQVAKAIHAIVVKGGAKGVSGGDIRNGVQGAALIQQLKAFVDECKGGKIKAVGQKSKMRYYSA